MEHFSDLAIILKSFPYQERDRIVTFLTKTHGKVTGVAKGSIHSRRFGGALDFLACSQVKCAQKPHAELLRIDEAVIHHVFEKLPLDFERLTAASFVVEFCMSLIESHSPAKDIFILVSHILHQLDEGALPVIFVICVFLCKAFKILGYSPSLLRCVQCARGAHEIEPPQYFWSSESGGMICGTCSKGRFKIGINSDTLFDFYNLTVTPLKELGEVYKTSGCKDRLATLYRLLADFLHSHVPGMPNQGLKSWKLLNETIGGLSA